MKLAKKALLFAALAGSIASAMIGMASFVASPNTSPNKTIIRKHTDLQKHTDLRKHTDLQKHTDLGVGTI
jgi:hypothetical protein